MKKILLSLMIILSLTISAQTSKKEVATVYNDSKTAISTVYNDTKSLAPKITKSVNEIAKSLKIGANSVWEILVRQQLVWSICFLILTLTSIFNWCLFYKNNLNNNLKYDKVKVINQKLFYNEDTKLSDIENYPNSYAAKYRNIEEEKLELIPNSTIPNFKYLHLTICLILSGLSIYHFGDMLTGFINPKFGALKTIAEIAINLK